VSDGVPAIAIVDAAREVLGANYRWWYQGANVPMWLDDGYGLHDVPASHIYNDVGIMCSDLINYACLKNGLDVYGGTEWWNNNIIDWEPFNPATDATHLGTICVKGFSAEWAQGHIALYTGKHTIIQSINYPGVTEDYTDSETYTWHECDFQWYGFIPGVDYSDAAL
jgi:hypothetical protein